MSKTNETQQHQDPETREELSDAQLDGVNGGIIAVLIGLHQADALPMESLSLNFTKVQNSIPFDKK